MYVLSMIVETQASHALWCTVQGYRRLGLSCVRQSHRVIDCLIVLCLLMCLGGAKYTCDCALKASSPDGAHMVMPQDSVAGVLLGA